MTARVTDESNRSTADRSPEGEPRLVNREIAWLSFNERVLQEAADRRNPLFERIRFLAIFSSNLDEFFRVRVAGIQSLLRLKKKHHTKLGLDPRKLLADIHETVDRHQRRFGALFGDLVNELRSEKIDLVSATDFEEDDRRWLAAWRRDHLLSELNAALLDAGGGPLFLKNRELYLVVALRSRIQRLGWGEDRPEEPEERIAVIHLPTSDLGRFVAIPTGDERQRVAFLDDVVRDGLPEVFPGFDTLGAWSVKLTRDADLNIDDEFSGDLLKKIRKGLKKRETGFPSRFLYDENIPSDILSKLTKGLRLEEPSLVAGGRYHNFSDLFSFPFPETDDRRLVYDPMPPLPHPQLANADDTFSAIAERDLILHFPYQSFDSVVRFLRDGADDPDVESMSITLYRVSDRSAIATALIDAARAGKEVTAFVELKARFDEESNLYWASEMEREGVRVLYSFPGLKVHTKLCLIRRREGDSLVDYAYLGTGNFNEKTARIYCDHALLTRDARLTRDVVELFDFLAGKQESPSFDNLLVAPFELRSSLNKKIDRAIEAAADGNRASILLKVNALEDPAMIERLYEAAAAGVDVRLIVRGICSIRTGEGTPGETIRARSILDRFLEHARVYHFRIGDDEAWYLASADWMRRNLDRRVEVAFPLFDSEVIDQIRTILELQLKDNLHARSLAEETENEYVTDDNPPVRSQVDTYAFVSWLQSRSEVRTGQVDTSD